MCGFAGFYAKQTLSSALLESMTTSLSHRGPDDQGFYSWTGAQHSKLWKRPNENSGNIRYGMGFRRLAIIDLSEGGAQPMSSPDGRYHICFNGEIYNYVELRKEISDVNLRSQSDTEVLLHCLIRWKEKALAKLNGIFAFSFFDSKTGELMVARDHFGIKPLYYFQDQRGIFFGSEIKALLKAREGRPSLRKSLLSRYLMTNWIPDPDTLFEDIYKLEPGSFLKVSPQLEVSRHTYWDLNYSQADNLSAEAWMEKLDGALNRAVDRQLRSDVPVAFFLSGGVDSSLLAAKAVKVQKERPTTFTIGFKWSHSKEDSLDVESARRMVKQFPFQHNEIILEPSIVSLLPRVVEVLEEPIADPAAICSYLICEAAAKKFKVLVSGQGGDEMFGGYPLYFGSVLAHHTQQLPAPLLSALNSAMHWLPYSVGNHRVQSVHRLQKLFSSAQHPWPEPFYLLRSSMVDVPLGELLNSNVASVQQPPFGRHQELFKNAESWEALEQALYLDAKTYLPSLNLTYTDKTSMAHSVEVRVPFLDLEIADLAQRLPGKLKTSWGHSKILLKMLAEKTLPQEVVHRKKTGFGLPVRDWLLSDLQPLAQDLLSESRLSRQKLLQPQLISRWLKEHREMRADHSAKIYSLMTLQLWLEKFDVSV